MKRELIPLNTEEMLKFYKELDIIEFKYHGEFVREKYQELSDYESENQFSMLTKKSYEDASQNLHLVYGEEKKTKESIQLVDLILNKIIGKYINIDGIERLFSMNYIDFEWEMHLSADYKKHNMKFYRDHFIHQIRDAYTAHVLLEQCDMDKQIGNVLRNESSSMISRYVGKILKKQARLYQDDLRQEVLKADPDFYIRNLIYMSMYMAALFHDIGYPEVHHLRSGERIIEYIAGIYNISDASASMYKIFALLQNSLLLRLVPFEKIEKRIVAKKDHGAISAIIFLLNFYENGSIFCLPPYKSAAVELAALAIYNHTNVYASLESKETEYDTMRPCFAANPISYLLRVCDDLQEWDRTYFLVSQGSNILFCNKCRTPIVGVRRSEKDGEYPVSEYRCNCRWAADRLLRREPDRFCFSQAFDGRSRFNYRRIYNITVCDEIRIDTSRLGQGKLLIRLHYDVYKLLHAAYAHPTYAKYRISELNKLKRMLEMQAEMPRVYLEYFVTSNPVHIKVKIIEDYMGKRPDGSGTMENKEEQKGAGQLSLADEIGIISTIKEHTCQESQITQNGLEYQKQIFEELAKKVTEKFSSNADENCIHGHFCRECSAYSSCGCRLEGVEQKENYSLQEALKQTDQSCPVRIMREYMERALRFYTDLYLCQQISRCENNRIARGEKGDGWGSFLMAMAEDYGERLKYFSDLRCLVEDCFLQFQRMYEDISALDYYPEAYYKQYAGGKRRESIFRMRGKDAGKEYAYESEKYYYKAALAYISPENYVPLLEWEENGNNEEYIDGYTDLYFFQQLVRRGGQS